MNLTINVSIEVPDDCGAFQAAESKIEAALRQSGAILLRDLLQKYEEQVIASRMKLVKDRRVRRIQSLVGEIEFERYRIFDRKTGNYSYPIDDWLGLKPREAATPQLRQRIISSCTERSYRKASGEVTLWTGIQRSAIGNWKMLQREAIAQHKKQEKIKNWCLSALPSLADIGVTENPCPLLAIDLDGTYCKSKYQKLKSHDVKVAVLYTGKTPLNKKQTRFSLKNKTVVVSRTGEKLRQFFNRVLQTAITHYGLNRESFVVMHGDGDAWIKTFQTEYLEKSVYYLDPWHVFKKIRIATGVKEIPQSWANCVYGKPDELIGHLATFKTQLAEQSDIEKIDELISYLRNNKTGLMPHNIPENIRKIDPRLFKKGSGQMESNICSTIADRFKQRRMSWTAYGLDNLATFRSQLLNNTVAPSYPVPDTKHRSKLWDGLVRYN